MLDRIERLDEFSISGIHPNFSSGEKRSNESR